ncbi:hypothetical protein Tco_1239994 [Tanacetum coccineum]
MASGGSDRDVKDARSKLLQMASPEVKGSLYADEDISVDEVSSAIDDVFNIGESNVESMKIRSKFGEFSENKESVKEVVVGGGELLGLDEDESNRVIPLLKEEGGEFDESLDEINLDLSKGFVIRVLRVEMFPVIVFVFF